MKIKTLVQLGANKIRVFLLLLLRPTA